MGLKTLVMFSGRCVGPPQNFWERNRTYLSFLPREIFKYEYPQAVTRLILTEAARVRDQVSPMGSVLDKVAQGEGLSEFFGFPLSTSFHRCFVHDYSCIIWERTMGPLAATVPLRHETQPHPTATSVTIYTTR
jgi:hypothetical protein